MLNGLEYTGRAGLRGEVDILDLHQPGEFLVVPVRYHHSHGIATHHVLIGTGAPGDQDVFQRDIPLVGTPSQGKALGGPYRHDIQELSGSVSHRINDDWRVEFYAFSGFGEFTADWGAGLFVTTDLRLFRGSDRY